MDNQEVKLLDHGFVRLVDSMGSDLSISRAARVSYDAEWRAGDDEGSDARLINYLMKNHHTSPFESVNFTFEVKAPMFVARQWMRHRAWCLSGDTEISFELPNKLRNGIRTAKKLKLKDLFRKWTSDPKVVRDRGTSLMEYNRKRISGMLLRVFDESTSAFTTGSIVDVMYSGVKPTYKITLSNGKTLTCSKEHRLLTSDGWRTLEDAVGLVRPETGTSGITRESYVMCNGVPAYRDKNWMKSLRDSGASVQDIADKAGVSYHTVRK